MSVKVCGQRVEGPAGGTCSDIPKVNAGNNGGGRNGNAGGGGRNGFPARHGRPRPLDLGRRPELVLSVLESDQLVAAKERARLGPRLLSRGLRVLLWGLRVYVVVMLVIVVIQVVRTVQALH